MAGEQSIGTFLPVPGKNPELKARSDALVEEVREPDVVARAVAAGRAAVHYASDDPSVDRLEIALKCGQND